MTGSFSDFYFYQSQQASEELVKYFEVLEFLLEPHMYISQENLGAETAKG